MFEDVFKAFTKEDQSLQKKREDAIKQLGNKWLFAKANYVQNKEGK